MRIRLKTEEAKLLNLEVKPKEQDGRSPRYRITSEQEAIIKKARASNPVTPDEAKEPPTKKKSPFIMSAWKTSGGVMNIDEYCLHHGLPREDVRGYKLVSHTGVPFYNIQFREQVSLESCLDLDFISEIVKTHSQDYKAKVLTKANARWIDRLVISDVHINMNNHGGANKLPIYDDVQYTEEEIFRRLYVSCSHVQNLQRGNELIIDNLGDYMDGEGGQTTRGGHSLPQIYSDKKAFEIGVRFKVELVETMLELYNKVTLNNVIDDNHSFLMSYYVHSAVKKILESKYPSRVTYNIQECFISNHMVGKHRFVLSHGKDSVDMKFGWKPKLDDKLVKSIDSYLKHHGLYDGCRIEIAKGDSHQYISDFTTSTDFEYHTYPAFSPPSSWVQHNFQNSRSGVVFQNIDLESETKTVIPIFF